MRLRPIEPGSTAYAAFIGLLEEAGLPTRDLHDEGARYYALGDGPEVMAFAGLAAGGDDALVRSVVVPQSGRGAGHGGAVIDHLATLASTYGVQRLWLLTTGGEGFFGRHGFASVDRSGAPPFIASTRQFTELCPSSAVLMCRTLV
ncbi:GNAT family N-acetyltransferase [Phenylobacterium sp.]|uniref:GNAT family N-acetyltransferase n=1 Tax=Phenylobacterium sp. TaxID=1871053 RepID=UPI00286DE8AF|nr:GNAT family N-acetyltransferase [Phenylobacterium sp.]